MNADINEIKFTTPTKRGKLFLGSINSLRYIPSLRIHTVISLCDLSELRPERKQLLDSVELYAYDIHDEVNAEAEAKMRAILVATCNVIHTRLAQNQNVLVHCYAGISRSSTVVINYVCWSTGMNIEQGIGVVERCRPIIRPNDVFLWLLTQLYSR